MNDKQYFKQLNGYYVKDEEASEHLKGIVKFHAIKDSSSSYVIEFPNGKNMIIDSGLSTQWTAIKAAIDGLGITKFDYAVITHFHSDHEGNIQNLINNYDFTDCTWYIQLRPDYVHYSSYIIDPESDYNEQVNILQNNGFTPVVPANNSYVIIDEDNDIKLHFLNTDPLIAQSYYDRYTENGEHGTGFNNFSLITEIIHHNVKILSTGDIERPVEDQYASYLTKVDVITAPHHSVNRDANRAFYFGTMPDYAVILLPSGSVQPTYRQLEYYKEIGTKVVSSYSSDGVNGLFTFESDGYTVVCNALYSTFTDTIFNYSRPLVNIGSLLDVTSYDQSTITLEQILINMPKGSQLVQRWSSDYNAAFPVLSSDIATIFPLFTYSMTVMLRAMYNTYEIRVFDGNTEMMATTLSNNINWVKNGSGINGTNINSQADLLLYLKNLTPGIYAVNYYRDTDGDSGVLQTDAGYALTISKTSATSAMITAVLKQSGSGSDKCRAAFAYASSLSTTPNILWHKVNN